MYEDNIQGIISDEQRRKFWIFTRTGDGMFKCLHLLAQDNNEEVYIIQKCEIEVGDKKKMVITMRDADGGFRQVVTQDMCETSEGCIPTALAAITVKAQTTGLDPFDENSFQPIDRFKLISWKPHI
jgi:hypothetical protein